MNDSYHHICINMTFTFKRDVKLLLFYYYFIYLFFYYAFSAVGKRFHELLIRNVKNESPLINLKLKLSDINNINKKVIILIVINVKFLIFMSVKN